MVAFIDFHIIQKKHVILQVLCYIFPAYLMMALLCAAFKNKVSVKNQTFSIYYFTIFFSTCQSMPTYAKTRLNGRENCVIGLDVSDSDEEYITVLPAPARADKVQA